MSTASARGRSRRAVQLLAALALLALGGAALHPAALQLRHAEQEAGLQLPEPAADTRDALTQQLFLFSLGGLRSLSAEILTLDATTAWSERDWERLARRWNTITSLNPRRTSYWMRASRDMHTNATSDVSNDERRGIHERQVLARHYLNLGERFLLDGLDNNPGDPMLYARLGDMYSDTYRRPQFAKAAAAYREAIRCGAPASLYERQLFYSLCRIRGHEQEAWQLGRRLYKDPEQRVPSLLCLLFVLEHKLALPAAERLTPAQLFGNEARARKQFARYLHNRLGFPTDGVAHYLAS